MGALLVLAILALYLWIAYRLLRRVNSIWGKALMVVAFALIPAVDAIYGRIKLRHLCETESGLAVYKAAENVDGLYYLTGPDERWIKEYGFTFAESSNVENRGVDRLSLQSNGTIVLEKSVEPRSFYRLRFVRGNLSDVYLRDAFVIETSDGKNLLGQVVNFNYSGGWVERAIGGLYGGRASSGLCRSSADMDALRRELVLATIRPAKKTSGGKER